VTVSLLNFVQQTDSPKRAGLVEVITNESVFLKDLRFITIDGFTYRYSKRSTLGGIAFRALNAGYTADVGVINPAEEQLAILGGEVQTDRQLLTGKGAQVRANNIAGKLKKAGLFFDKYVIDGDPAVDPKQFYGLNARLTGNQVITAGADGAQLTLSMVDDLLDRVVGTNDQKRLVMNKGCSRKLKQLVVASAGGAAVTDVGGHLSSYDGAEIKLIDEDGDEAAILGFDETQGNDSATASMYCYRPGQDTDGEYLQGLIKEHASGDMIEHENQGVRGTVNIDLVEAAVGIGLFHPRAASRLKGIKIPA